MVSHKWVPMISQLAVTGASIVAMVGLSSMYRDEYTLAIELQDRMLPTVKLLSERMWEYEQLTLQQDAWLKREVERLHEEVRAYSGSDQALGDLAMEVERLKSQKQPNRSPLPNEAQ